MRSRSWRGFFPLLRHYLSCAQAEKAAGKQKTLIDLINSAIVSLTTQSVEKREKA